MRWSHFGERRLRSGISPIEQIRSARLLSLSSYDNVDNTCSDMSTWVLGEDGLSNPDR